MLITLITLAVFY